jgi:hypothetical protein
MGEPGWSFEEAYKKLPPDAQQRVQGWMGTQMFIARELGLTPEAWFDHVAWAFKNPLDFSFMGKDGVEVVLGGSDKVESTDPGKRAAATIGVAGGNLPPSPGGPADPTKVKKAGLSTIHMLGDLLPQDKQGGKKTKR